MHKGKTPWNKDKPWDKEILEKITKINQKRTKNPNYIHPMQGKNHTTESNEKNRIAHLGNKNAEGHIVTQEVKDKISIANKGHISPMKGVTRKLESNLKQSVAMKGKSSWNSGLTSENDTRILSGENHPLSGITPDEIIRKQISESLIGKMSGENHWNYQGGITPLHKQIRFCDKSDEWRTQIFTRDNFTCQECNKNSCYIEAHHIKPFNLIIKENNITSLEQALLCPELWDISNGKTLCKECHDKIPKK